jgi:hypothetical protein
MPRRKKKVLDHLFKPGTSGNPAGRPVGSTNEVNNAIKTAFAMLLHNQLPNLEAWLAEGAKKDPLKTADLLLRVSERFMPSLSRTELVGKDGEAFTPITIHLPNIPKVSLGVGAPTDNPLLSSPAGEVKELGEGAPSTFVNGVSFLDSPVLPIETPGPMDPPVDQSPVEAPSPMFQVPPLSLSPNQLKDLRDMGEVPPDTQGGMGEPTE